MGKSLAQGRVLKKKKNWNSITLYLKYCLLLKLFKAEFECGYADKVYTVCKL